MKDQLIREINDLLHKSNDLTLMDFIKKLLQKS